MRKLKAILLTVTLLVTSTARAQELPVWNEATHPAARQDWLVNPITTKAGIYKSANGKDIVLYNGLVKRIFRTTPNLACTDYTNLTTGRQLLRAVSEEARLTINGKKYNIGGLKGQLEKAYLLPEWVDNFTAGPQDFRYVSFEIAPIKPQLAYKSTNWTLGSRYGSGKTISFLFKAAAPELAGIEVKVTYEIYDGIPLIVKSLQVENKGGTSIKLNQVVNEVLGMVEEDSAVDGSFESMKKPQGIYFETNYAFNNAMRYPQSDQTSHWKTDSSYTSQVHYSFKTPVLFENYEEKAPGIILAPGENFKSIRTHELLMSSYDREARGMAVRRMYSAVAPWTLENPIFMHLVSKTDTEVRTAIDQCAATGYEALILSFGSHLNIEDTTAANVKRWKEIAAYAHSRHIKIGCYSLFSSRSINPETDVIDPKTNKPGGAYFGNAPCFGSKWGLWYRDNIEHFFEVTSFDIFENDGPYPGDVCASTTHPGHKGADDSQWRQMEIQKGLYHWLKQHGVYINAPDWYFLDGSNKIALGYREVNFSLPRAQQKIINRQNIFDGTWDKSPSMGWGFVPLTQYQGGGAAATLEPLADHLKDYEQLMMQYYGAGIQACYRGPRLYDTEITKQLVIKTINWYKKHRKILNSDIIHLRRADGRDWDGILHVNPALTTKGLMMLYNPTKETITRTVKIPLYYTSLTSLAKVQQKDGAVTTYRLNRDYTIDIKFTIAPEDYTWFTFE
ncbi:alpha-galactosidase [Mucilaginibacter xinganensis]|uniref:Alpha-galactosidase n=1 Tax=Mucilaginibacter xinganensis TaxID=1234841 RepID=A0A223P0H1_9SPHI|nr:alpha-galactosidase [Mucilaginibacter xinganensis]ASU35649.1 alpha-galactosidase [Mucilaginibacter xinganensis]